MPAQKNLKIWTGDETNKDCLVILMSNDDYISLFDWVERRLTNKNKLWKWFVLQKGFYLWTPNYKSIS